MIPVPSPAWPFDPAAGTLPPGYSQRFFGAWRLGQDPIGWAMAVPCSADCEELHGPSPIFGDTLGRQLDALACDYVYTYPAQHPERIEWAESAFFYDTNAVNWHNVAGMLEATFEVARLRSESAGALRIETIETYLRVTIADAEGDLQYFVLGAPTDTLAGGASITEPFPFPLDVGLPTALEWRWQLVHQWIGELGREPPRAIGLRERQAVPATSQPRAPWTDNRFGWGGRHADRQQITLGGTGIVRLFVTLRTLNRSGWDNIRVGGALRGFYQDAGRDAAAARNTTHRLI